MPKYKKGYQVIVNNDNAANFESLTKTIRPVKMMEDDNTDAVWVQEPGSEYPMIAVADTVFAKRQECHDATETALRDASASVCSELDNIKDGYAKTLKNLRRLDE